MGRTESIGKVLELVARDRNLRTSILEPGDKHLEEVRDRLADFYSSSKQGYLNSPAHCVLDERMSLSQRSKVVIVQDDGCRLTSTVRITPHPHESKELVAHAINAESLSGHFELGRLVTWNDGAFRNVSTALALGVALLHARSMGACGLVALVRPPQRRIFSKFGLRPIHSSPIKVPIRDDGSYWLLEASMDSILDASHVYALQLLRTAFPLGASRVS